MSLISAARMARNQTVKERCEAAIRQIAYAKVGFAGPPGRLAEAGMTAPETVSAPFLWELSADATVTDTACPECGHAQADDNVLRFVVETKWDAIAAKLCPDPVAPA